MAQLIVSRLWQSVCVLLVVSALTFALLAASGGDAVAALQNDRAVSEETLERLRHIYGLDQPIALRYARWLAEAVHGRLGHSFYFQVPVGTVIWPRLLHTTALATLAMIIAWATALGLGVAAGRRRGGWVDRGCSVVILLSATTPRLVLALVILAFAAHTSMMSVGGPPAELSASAWVWRILTPALVLSTPLVALFLAQTRSVIGEALKTDHVRAARAKGLPERAVLFRHVLRPSLNPLISILGYSLGNVMSGSVVVEKVLGWPGIGQLSVDAVKSRDVPLLMGVVVVTAAAVLAGNLLADVLMRLNDPRLR
jgi:peptide/nickel transport system permease protein